MSEMEQGNDVLPMLNIVAGKGQLFFLDPD